LTGSCEKRGLLATEAKRKSEAVIAGATSLWPTRGARMAKAARHRCRVVLSAFSRLCNGRNRARQRP
jgi:hypothetical protein